MQHQRLSLIFLIFFTAGALILCACTATPAATQPAPTQPSAPVTDSPSPTPAGAAVSSGTQGTAEFTDPDPFAAALLQAIMGQDKEKLLGWMTSPIISGGWGSDISDSSPQHALDNLFTDQLSANNQLSIVKDADFKALMGDLDPLSIPRSDAGVIKAVLASGWGKDGRDEAIVFIAQAADGSLKWHGWVTVNGGFTGERQGGVEVFANDAYGYKAYLPKGFEVIEDDPKNVLIMAPGVGHPGQTRAAAFIAIEPANGLDVNAIVEMVKADVGPGIDIPPGTAMGLDKTMAIVLTGLPGQDVNRQLFMVYNDLLYHITFVPDTPAAGESFSQMEDLYAQITNTFHFTE